MHVSTEAKQVSLSEMLRLKDMHALNMIYTPAEARFDRITRLTARILKAPIAMINFIAEDHQWTKSSFGLSFTSLPRGTSFCNLALSFHGPFVVPDATQDERVANNAIVTGPPFVRFYAGHAIHAESGSAVGALCIMDTLSRQLGPDEQETLQDLAIIAERELSRSRPPSFQDALIQSWEPIDRRNAVDEVTRMWNRVMIEELIYLECTHATSDSSFSLLFVDIDRLSIINEHFGMETGDRALSEIARQIRHSIREDDACGRYDVNCFAVLLQAGLIDSKLVAERICEMVVSHGVPGLPMPLTVSVGVACVKETKPSPAILMTAAAKALREAKVKGGNQVATALL